MHIDVRIIAKPLINVLFSSVYMPNGKSFFIFYFLFTDYLFLAVKQKQTTIMRACLFGGSGLYDY